MFLVRVGAGIGHAVSLPALVAVGLLVGYIAGMFGVGGGFLLTPVLMYVFGVPPPTAVASGVMGIGGGVLFMPILLYGFGLSARNAAGTGVLLLFATVAVGTIEQALRGYVALKLAMAILIGSSIGSQLGALTTNRLPNRLLRLIFSCLVAATVLMIAWDLVGLLGIRI